MAYLSKEGTLLGHSEFLRKPSSKTFLTPADELVQVVAKSAEESVSGHGDTNEGAKFAGGSTLGWKPAAEGERQASQVSSDKAKSESSSGQSASRISESRPAPSESSSELSPSLLIGSLSSNPNAKEFKLNPNVKSFKPSHAQICYPANGPPQLNSMAPRWKWKGAEAKALAEPVSKSVSELQLSLANTESSGSLSSSNVLLAVEPEQAELLDRCCFGRLILSAEKVKKWIQLSFEEAFYLFYNLKCIKIYLQGRCLESEVDTWMYMRSKRPNFPIFFKAYSHLRLKNWVLRSGLQYGVDYVAYRHHPSLVHSEYSVLVQSGDDNDRLRVWSDIHCAVRLSGSVAKTLLILHVSGNIINTEDLNVPLCLEKYRVEEQTISRWSPELSRED